jgi:arylsulfatase A-like enzyme
MYGKIVGACAGALLTPAVSAPLKGEERPNVIVFLVDDFGWRDLGCYGSSYYETPSVDKLASLGVKFTDAYSACTVSSPSRAALMTGKYPARLHLTDWIAGYKRPKAKLSIPDWQMFLPLKEHTLAEILKENGYHTAIAGKWHLGEDSIFWPENQGFEFNAGGYSKGSPNSYFSPYNNPRLKDGQPGEYLTDRLTEESLGYIRKNKNNPFFLYLSHYAVHNPFQAKKEMVEKYRGKTDPVNPKPNPVYGAMVESMDQSLGRIMKELEDLDLLKKTFVIFLSDNGGLCPSATTNYPLRAGKGSAYEGGVRTPLIIYGPGIPGGKVVGEPAITMDVFSTILDLLKIRSSDKVDGISLLPVLKGKADSDGRPLFWHYPHYHTQGATPYSAVRKSDWRLIHFYEDDHVELYNLAEDISEKNDLSGSYPDKVKELSLLLEDWLKETNAQLPKQNINYNPQAQMKER